MPYFDGKMPYLVLPRRKSKCLRENRKLAKPKFMFYQSLTRIRHNLQVHVESQIKIFSYCRNIKNRSYRTFVIKQGLIKNTQTTQFLSDVPLPIYDESYSMTNTDDSSKFNEG